MLFFLEWGVTYNYSKLWVHLGTLIHQNLILAQYFGLLSSVYFSELFITILQWSAYMQFSLPDLLVYVRPLVPRKFPSFLIIPFDRVQPGFTLVCLIDQYEICLACLEQRGIICRSLLLQGEVYRNN